MTQNQKTEVIKKGEKKIVVSKKWDEIHFIQSNCWLDIAFEDKFIKLLNV